MNIVMRDIGKKSTIRDISYVLALFSFLALGNVLHCLICFGLPAQAILIKPVIQGASYVFMLFCVLLNRKMPVPWMLFNILYMILLLSGALLHSETWSYTRELLKDYILSIFPITLCLATIGDMQKLMRILRTVSYFALAKIAIYPLVSRQALSVLQESGMGMAYGSVVCWAVVTHFAFRERKIIDMMLSAYCALILIVFGTRGVLLCIAGFLTYQSVSIGSLKKRIVTVACIAILAMILVLNYYVLLEGLSAFLQRLNLSSSVLRKVTYFGLAYDNGRTALWSKMFDEIGIFANGIGYDRVIGGSSGMYAHNLFIELLVAFGIPLGLLLIVGILFLYRTMLFGRMVRKEYRDAFAVFAIPGFFMLMVSGSIFSTYMLFSGITIWIVWKYNTNKSPNFNMKAENVHESTAFRI